VNFADLVLLAQNYNRSLVSLDSFSPEFAADWALAQSLVPEPTSLTLVMASVAAMSTRRRRA
jgi:hypothetical protein